MPTCFKRSCNRLLCVLPFIISLYYYYHTSLKVLQNKEYFTPYKIPHVRTKSKICLYNRTITYDGKIIKSKNILYLKIDNTAKTLQKTEPEAKKPRGFVFNASLTFWSYVNDKIDQKKENSTKNQLPSNNPKSTITIQSYTYRRQEPELWFTKQHIHDTGAVQNEWQYSIPGYKTIYGYSQNKFVNQDQQVQDERGVIFTLINGSNYDLKDQMCLYVASREISFTPWWKNWIGWQAALMIMGIIHGMYTLVKKFKLETRTWLRRFWIFYQIFIGVIADMYSDQLYLFNYPHKSPLLAALLMFNFLLPHWLVFVILTYYTNTFTYFAKSQSEFYMGFRDWSKPGIRLDDKIHTMFIVVTLHKIFRFYAFYQDILYIGSYWNSYLMIVPLFTFYGWFKIIKQTYSSLMTQCWKEDYFRTIIWFSVVLIIFLYFFIYDWIFLRFFVSEDFVRPQTDFFGVGEGELNHEALFVWWILPTIYFIYVFFYAYSGYSSCKHFQKRLKHRQMRGLSVNQCAKLTKNNFTQHCQIEQEQNVSDSFECDCMFHMTICGTKTTVTTGKIKYTCTANEGCDFDVCKVCYKSSQDNFIKLRSSMDQDTS